MREAAWPSRTRAYYALLILTLALMVATIDRGVLSVLVEYIKRDLHVSDTQFSVLSGFAFVFFYAFLGLPIARLADRHSRRLIIGIGIAFWSLMTALSGIAQSYQQLFWARVAVGAGESSFAPATYSILTDSFPRDRLPMAMSLLSIGFVCGALQLNSQLIQDGIPYTGTQNIGGANIYGYEAELQARPFGGLAIDGSVAYTGFKYTDLGINVGCGTLLTPPACIPGNPSYSDYPVSQPKLKANVGLAYSFGLPNGSKITPRFDATYQTQVFADVVNQTPGAIIPSHTIVNGRIQWDAPGGKWSLAALGTNLTNKEYYLNLFDLRAFGEGIEEVVAVFRTRV